MIRNRLEKILKTKPPVCPKCNKEVKFGYLMYVTHARGFTVIDSWLPVRVWQKESDNTIHGQPWLAEIPGAIPSYLCENCNLILGQYKTNVGKKYNYIESKKKGICPYCKNPIESAFLSGEFAFHDNYRNFSPFEVTYLTPVYSFRSQYLVSRLCKHCGIYFSKYKPNPKAMKKIKTIMGLVVAIYITIIVSVIFIYLLLCS